MISGNINIFDDEINDSQNLLDGMSLIMLFIFFVCFIISCIFMSSQINVELYYRKKEIGFMQIFGLKKKKILKIILSGYLLKMLTSFALSIVIYGIGVWVYFIVFKMPLMVSTLKKSYGCDYIYYFYNILFGNIFFNT